MRPFPKEPLLHFLLLAGAPFVLFHFIDAVIVVAAIAAGIGRWIVRRIPSPRLWQPTAAHLICTAAAYWTIQRVLGFQLMTDA